MHKILMPRKAMHMYFKQHIYKKIQNCSLKPWR